MEKITENGSGNVSADGPLGAVGDDAEAGTAKDPQRTFAVGGQHGFFSQTDSAKIIMGSSPA